MTGKWINHNTGLLELYLWNKSILENDDMIHLWQEADAVSH